MAKFQGIPVEQTPQEGGKFGGIPVESGPAFQGRPVEEPVPPVDFTEQFSEGFDLGGGTLSGLKDRAMEANLPMRAGALLMEQQFRNVGFGNLVDENERAEKFEFWQPQIWDAQDRMHSIKDQHSIEYQVAWENVQNLKKNMRDDLNGEYNPDSNFNLSDLVEAVRQNPGFMLGRLTSDVMLDPAMLMVPGGALAAGEKAAKFGKAAQIAAEISGAATVAGTWTALEEVAAQKEKNSNQPLDFNAVAEAAVPGATMGAFVPLVEKTPKALRSTITKGKDIWDARTITQIERRAQEEFLKSQVNGNPIDKDVAVNIAIAKHQNLKDKVMSNKDVFMSDSVLGQIKNPRSGKTSGPKRYLAEKAEGAVDKWNKFTQPITSTLRNMGYPNLARKLNEHDMNLGTAIHQKQEITQRFSKAFDKLSENEQRLAAISINNGTFERVRGQFSDEFNASYSEVRDLMERHYDEMTEAGMDVGYTENFFPREFDYQRYAKDNGIVISQMNREFADAINSKLNLDGGNALNPGQVTNDLIERHLDADDIARIMQKKTAAMSPQPSVNTSTDNVQARTIDQIDPELMEYYSDPRGALHNYINRTTVKMHDRAFFGGEKLKEMAEPDARLSQEELTDHWITSDLNNLVNEGRIRAEDLTKVTEIMQARFIGSKKPAHKVMSGGKNIMYALTLGNPISAAVQLGDIAASAYMNGLTSTLNGVIKRAGKDVPGFDMDDFGLQHIPEMEAMDWTKTFAEMSMKFGGFQAIDRLGKNTILNATYNRLRKEVLNPKKSDAEKFKFFKDRYGERLGDDEVFQIMEGIKSGDPTNPHARLALYSDLTRVQPISMSEMPVGYMNHPDGRVAYMLKTFTMKQIDLMRQESLRIMRQGAKNKDAKMIAQGAMAMGKIIGTIGLGNAGVDVTRQFIAGDDDFVLTDSMISSVLRNYGLSQYTFDAVRRGDVAKGIGGIVAPPINVVTKPVASVFGVDNGARPTDLLPVVGKPIHLYLDRQER